MKSEKKKNHRLTSWPCFKWVNLLSVMVIAGLLLTPTATGLSLQDTPNSPAANSIFYPWNTEIVDGPPFFYFMTDRHLRYDKSANHIPCVVYGGDHLYFSCWNIFTDSWSLEIVDSGPMVGSYAALDFNEYNIPFISYYDAHNATLKLAYKAGINWVTVTIDRGAEDWVNLVPAGTPESTEPEVLIPEQAQEAEQTYWDQLLEFFPYLPIFAPGFLFGKVGVGKHTSIDVDANNGVHVSYYDELHGALKYAYWDGTLSIDPPCGEHIDPNRVYVCEFVDFRHDGDLGLWTSIVADDWFRPQIAYMDEKYDDLKYAIKMGPTWTTMVVDNGVNVGPFASITLLKNSSFPFNPRLTPYIVYMAFNYNAPQFALKHARLQNDNVSWSKGTIDPSLGVGLFASVVKAADGRLHVSYYDGLKGDLKYATSADGNGWNVRTLLTTGVQGLFTSIDMGWDDEPAISYFDATNGALKVIYKDGQNWINIVQPVGFASNVGLNTSLVIDVQSKPHISYLNETRGLLKYANKAGASWTTEVITHTASLGTFHSIGMAALFVPTVAYYDVRHGDLLMASKPAAAWVEDYIDQYDDVGSFVSLDTDLNGTPHVSYVNATWDQLNHAKWNITASSGVTNTVDYFDVGGNTSIAIDGLSAFGNPKPGISYFDFVQETLRYAYQTPFEVWQNILIAALGNPADSEPILEPYSALDFDNLGYPHIAFYDEINGDLRYAYFDGSEWIGEDDLLNPPLILDSVGDVGRNVSLVIDQSNNNRHLCYYDTTNGDLKYAYYNGISWFFDIVDGYEANPVLAGDKGLFCSIDLNRIGQPGISYYDASNTDLKFATGAGYTYVSLSFLPVVIR